MHDSTPATPAKTDKNLKDFYVTLQKNSSSSLFAGVHINARVACGVSRANSAGRFRRLRAGLATAGTLQMTLTRSLTCGFSAVRWLGDDGGVRKGAGQSIGRFEAVSRFRGPLEPLARVALGRQSTEGVSAEWSVWRNALEHKNSGIPIPVNPCGSAPVAAMGRRTPSKKSRPKTNAFPHYPDLMHNQSY